MTQQEIFNRSVHHLLTMPRQARRPDGNCVHRTPDGLACVVGDLLTDQECQLPPDFEDDADGPTIDDLDDGGDVMRLADLGLLPERLVPHVEMLAELQRVHDDPMLWTIDGPANRELMVACLKQLASDYELEMPPTP